ncbi:hypothetical protein F4803DRAFT_509530 [Xylaria telfairii]|nr:hypothetical protein F4803DRAFT_509530 [Xylaria telfairii]
MGTLTPSAQSNFNTSVAFLVVATVAVVARFSTRLLIGQRPSGPDWLCLLALIFLYGYCIVIFNFIFNVSRFYAFDFNLTYPLEELQNFLLAVFILEVFFTLIITSVKLSILWLCHNLFHINRTSRWMIYGTGVLCILWFLVATFVLVIFQCHPIDAYWKQLASSSGCFNTQKTLLGYEVTNFFLDFAILVIPVTAIGTLQLSLYKKIGASFAFLLGGFVCIASIVRLTTIYDVSNPSRPVEPSASLIWSTIQAGVAIVCSCIPTFGPLIANITKKLGYVTRLYGTYGPQGRRSRDLSSVPRAKYQYSSSREEGDTWNTAIHNSHGTLSWRTELGGSNEHILQPLPLNGIIVNRQVDVV